MPSIEYTKDEVRNLIENIEAGKLFIHEGEFHLMTDSVVSMEGEIMIVRIRDGKLSSVSVDTSVDLLDTGEEITLKQIG